MAPCSQLVRREGAFTSAGAQPCQLCAARLWPCAHCLCCNLGTTARERKGPLFYCNLQLSKDTRGLYRILRPACPLFPFLLCAPPPLSFSFLPSCVLMPLTWWPFSTPLP